MLELWTSEKGYQAPTEGGTEGGREGGRDGGTDGHQMPLAVDFPQVQLVYIIIAVCPDDILCVYVSLLRMFPFCPLP